MSLKEEARKALIDYNVRYNKGRQMGPDQLKLIDREISAVTSDADLKSLIQLCKKEIPVKKP
jgi:hypothetical protein